MLVSLMRRHTCVFYKKVCLCELRRNLFKCVLPAGSFGFLLRNVVVLSGRMHFLKQWVFFSETEVCVHFVFQ